MATSNDETPEQKRRRRVLDVVYGLASGVLIAVLKLTEYRVLILEHSVELYLV